MKKAIIISALIIAAAAQTAAAVTPVYDGNVVSIELKTELQKDDEAVVSVVKKGAALEAENAFAIDELAVSDNGIVKFDFEMPEQRNNEPTEGEYVIYVNGAEFDTFSFASKNTRDSFEEFLRNAASGADIIDAIDNNAGYRIAAIGIGLDENVWDSLSADEKSAAVSGFVSSERQTDTVSKFLTYVGAKALSVKKADAEKVLNMINPKYKDKNYKSITDSETKSFIDSYINAAAPSAEKFSEEYERANVLNLLNNAKYNEVDALVTENAALLGLSGKTQYEKYLNMSSANKTKVAEEIVRKLKTSKVTTAAAFETVFNSCTNIQATSGTGSSGSSGNGGSGNGGSSGNSYGTNTVVAEPQIKEDDFVFADVKDHWSKTAVMSLYKKGIVSGTDKNEFEPSRNVTREEFVTMLIKAKGIEAKDTAAKFADTAEGAWYNVYVNAAAANQIVYGIGENSFGIGTPITRQDMFCMVARILEADDKTVQDGNVSDIDSVSDYAKDAVTSLYRRGIISGTGDGKSEPNKNTTRAEAAALIYKLLSI